MNYFYRNRGNKTKFPGKGRNIIAFPDDYVVLDVETTGHDYKYDDIIEIACLKVQDRKPLSQFHTFVKPCDGFRVPEFIEALTGITTDMLNSAPSFSSVSASVSDFVGDSLVVGHNINFDINFLISNGIKDFANDYIDTLRISRRITKELPSHRLKDLVDHYGVPFTREHRSLDDCYSTYYVFEALRNDIAGRYSSTDAFIEDLKKYPPHPHNHPAIDVSSIVPTVDYIDENSPFYQKNVCFTGALEKMIRKDAMQLVVNLGGVCQNGITAKTNYLVLGNLDYVKTIKDGKSSKLKKAERYILEGKDLEILSENAFYDMVEESSED